MQNNLLDPRVEHNFLFLASVIATLCEQGAITLDLNDIEKFWKGDIIRLKYDLAYQGKQGAITFSLKEKE